MKFKFGDPESIAIARKLEEELPKAKRSLKKYNLKKIDIEHKISIEPSLLKRGIYK